MRFFKLNLVNFRNFPKLHLELASKTNLIIGPNSSGKTNICEALMIASYGRSLRSRQEEEIIKMGENFARVEAEVGDGIEKREIVFVKRDEFLTKKFLLGGARKRFSTFLGSFFVILFSPAEIDFLFSTPQHRRYHLNLFLSSTDRSYLRTISAYQKVLRSRNKVLGRLRERRGKRGELFFWNRQLLELGEKITQKRQDFFQFMNDFRKKEERSWLSDFGFFYKANLVSGEKLERGLEEEIKRGLTLFGPHRDDFSFKLRRRDLLHFGSRGEQRLAVLALKLAEISYIQESFKKRPVLVLDDVFSELDRVSRRKVVEEIPRQQTIVTSAESSVEKILPEGTRIIRLGT